MLGADLFEALEHCARGVRGSMAPFGGLQVWPPSIRQLRFLGYQLTVRIPAFDRFWNSLNIM